MQKPGSSQQLVNIPNSASNAVPKKQEEAYPTHFSTMPSSKFSASDSRGRSWPGLPMNFQTLPRNSRLRVGLSSSDKASTQNQTSLSNIFVDGVGLSASYHSIVASHPNIDSFSTHPSDHKTPKKNALSPNPSSQDSFSTGHRVLLAQWNTHYQSPISIFSVTPSETQYSKEKNLEALAVTGHIDGSILLYKINPPLDKELLISNTGASDVDTDSIKKFYTSMVRYVISFGPLQQVTSTHFVPIRSDLPLVSQTFWGLFTGTEQGEIMKWDCRDGRCLARLSPAAQFALKGKNISQLITVGNPLPTFLLCSGPGILVALNCDNLELVVDLSKEANFDMFLALPAHSLDEISQTVTVPILAKGHSLGDLSLGALTLPHVPGLSNIQWKCALSLPNFQFSEWSLNTHGPTDGFERILLISRNLFVLVQVDSTNMIRQLTQYISPPSNEAWGDGAFFADNRLVVRTLSGGIYQYTWGLDGSLVQVGEIKGLYGFPVFPTRGHLIGLCPSSSGLQLAGWRINFEASSETSQHWVGPIIEANTLNQDTFPIKDKQCPNIDEHADVHSTVIVPVSLGSEHKTKDWAAKGLSCGTISIQPLSQLFFTPQNIPRSDHQPPRGVGFEENNEKWLIGHRFAITSLFEPTPKRLGEKLFLISGDALGMVKLWELSSGVCLASFQGHSQAVSLLFQLPVSQEVSKTAEIQSIVVSVGLDNSVAMFCLRRMVCLGLIPGHTHSIHRIIYSTNQTKDSLPTIHVKHEDDYISHWHLSRSGLAMVPNEVLNFEWICGIEIEQQHANVDRKATIVTYPHWDMYHEYPALQLFEVDVRRLLSDLHSSLIPSVRFLTRVESIFPSGCKSSVPAYASSSLLKGTSGGSVPSDKSVASALSYSLVSALLDSAFSSKSSTHSSALLQGTRGAGGLMSFLIHSRLHTDSQPTPCNPWFLSPRFTASRLLPSMALSLKLIGDDALKEGCRLLDSDPSFQIPCLGILARYWVDASPEIQHSSQTLFRTLISQLEYTRQEQLADFWIAQLPTVVPGDLLRSSSAGCAVLVLGILATNYPELLPESTTLQKIARGLEWLLSPHARATFRMVAIDIVSKGFMTFEGYLDGVWVLRTLYALKEEAPRLARQAVLYIATANAPLFITSLGLATGLSQLSAIMELLPYIIQQRQTLLFPYIPRVVEIIVKALDPKDSDTRHYLLPAATQCLHDLVAAYANVDFHPGSQRLAVGAMEGAAIVYDLRTSTRCLVVEGYVTPTTAVSFSPDGKFLATFAHQESLVKIWNTSGGLLDMLSKSLRGHSPAPIPASPSRTRSPSSLAAVFLPGYLNVNTQNLNSTFSAPASGRASPVHSSNSSLLNIPPAQTSVSSPLNFFSSAPTPYRTFNVSLESRSPPTSPGVIMRTIELHFVGDRSLNLVTDGLNLSFNI